jgi:hypothetical protein
LLTEGSTLEDPNRFAQNLTQLLSPPPGEG